MNEPKMMAVTLHDDSAARPIYRAFECEGIAHLDVKIGLILTPLILRDKFLEKRSAVFFREEINVLTQERALNK